VKQVLVSYTINVHFTRSQIEELGINQLTPQQLERAHNALNGFAEEFGKPWVEQIFGPSRASSTVLCIVSAWEDWRLVKVLHGSNEIKQRWTEGFNKHGVSAEVQVVAALLWEQATVELAPQIDGRVPDFRFKKDSTWVYCEVSERGISKVRQRASEILQKLADGAATAVQGRFGKLAVLTEVNDDEVQEILSWLTRIGTPHETRLRDIAVFYADELTIPISENDLIERLVPKPRLMCVHISDPVGVGKLLGAASLPLLDDAARRILEQEAGQLPRDEPNLVFLDVSSVIGGDEVWPPLIRRSFQPTINTRISGVVVFSSVLDSCGRNTKWSFLSNSYARRPIPESELQVVQRIAGQSN
jgi:hypothetical protein